MTALPLPTLYRWLSLDIDEAIKDEIRREIERRETPRGEEA